MKLIKEIKVDYIDYIYENGICKRIWSDGEINWFIFNKSTLLNNENHKFYSLFNTNFGGIKQIDRQYKIAKNKKRNTYLNSIKFNSQTFF